LMRKPPVSVVSLLRKNGVERANARGALS
jgi:hypothetical protein